MQHQLRVDTSGVQPMAGGRGASASELHTMSAPGELGLPGQASATAVNTAHADVTAFTAGLSSWSDITRGLARDTRESLFDPAGGPWLDVRDAVIYYYACDFDERQPWGSFRQPGEPDTILWDSDRQAGLPERPSDIPEAYRYTPPEASSEKPRRRQDPPVINEPRRYVDPRWLNGPLPDRHGQA